ncbi:hypothetical protein PDJAM_G00202170 [Pangasius djambal]|uniref:Uncharacterized protein n=1 Tax=Pangasius djambal TaxID=1691987 RepID=A0ACC5Y7N8_9TELE|nr:hypothetical protein [Pangasius djambal]
MFKHRYVRVLSRNETMFCGYWNVDLIRLLCFSVMLAGVASESVKPPKPNVNITQEGQRLRFQASTPNYLPPQCWKYRYIYSKCNEESKMNETGDNPTLHVEYDTACKYTVQGQVIYSSYCGGDVDIESDMSEPVYYGEDGDPNLAFKVAMIITPLTVCCSLIAAIVLFRRYKEKFFPKVPSPSHFFNDMFDRNKEMTKSLYVTELYVPNEEVVEEIQEIMNSNQ